MPQHFVVIIAGGKGERFWPQSRAHRPKHLLPIVGTKPMLAQTLDRVRPLVPAKNTFVITSAVQEKAVREVCAKLPKANIVAEPVGRDTAPAVALAAALVGARDPRGIFAVLRADVMVTIGIAPTEPATGFGYIQRGEKWKTFERRPLFQVKRFVEKPSLEIARQYLASGDYMWNAGMFVWSVGVVNAALTAHAPELDAGLAPIRVALAKRKPLGPVLKKVYPTLTKISVDYALLEKSQNVVVLPSSFDWGDVGSWSAVPDHHEKDAAGNVTRGLAIVEQGKNNIVFSADGHLTAVLGADEMIVVHTPDATLVAPKAKAQEIKALLKRVESLKGGAKWL
jgi:mannose-1-phosphate guanylyltransferase